ncbi:flagellar hook capping FlgD N-terminal domain-containing protein [Nocardioides stalactiti]|uniref:flagellar hook capping FlgD N-terminal domain-containing protein n=1 Tax=Nocardioides stalactiti TaxID=2755356 RepID=UPI00160202E1|nr:flagellar hook capping FlgD N-terminal domain-containing protein [Nocardioides stalactiti]
MSVTPTEATGGTPWSAQPTSTTGMGGFGDQQLFLELMVTQLRYQDPLNPTDSAEFLAQTAQFTSLEKIQAVADQTAMMVSTQLAFGASSLIGQTVTYNDSDGNEHTGTVQGTTFLPTGPVLDIDGEQVSLFNVLSVGVTTDDADPATDPATDPANDPDSTAPAAG